MNAVFLETCESQRDAAGLLEREILEELSQQALYSNDLLNRIETLENEISLNNPVENVRVPELFARNLEEKENLEGRYSKMSEEQADKLYKQRISQLKTQFQATSQQNFLKKPRVSSSKTTKTAATPLNSSTKTSKPRVSSSKTGKTAAAAAFSSKTSKPSATPQRKTSKTEELYTRGLEKLSKKELEMIESRERAAQKALESCTFTPILKKNPRLLHKYEDIIEKTRKNQQKKQESLRKPSSEARKLAEELKHCTFKPEISRFRRSSRDFDEKSDKTLRKDALSSKKRSFSSKTNSFSAKSLAKVENSSVSVRNSEEKARFRKANEQFLRKRSSERLFFEDFRKETRETPKNSKKNDKKAARNSHNFEEIPGFSKEIGETLEIFQRIRAHIQKPIEKPAQVQVRENPAKLAKIQRKSSIYNNQRNSSKLSENKENIKKLSQKPFKAKETRGKTVRNSGISHKNNGFSQSCQASTQKPANLSGKYATLLRKAEEITEHLNGVLFAKS